MAETSSAWTLAALWVLIHSHRSTVRRTGPDGGRGWSPWRSPPEEEAPVQHRNRFHQQAGSFPPLVLSSQSLSVCLGVTNLNGINKAGNNTGGGVVNHQWE